MIGLAVGAGIQAAGSLIQGVSASRAASYNANIANQNAALTLQQGQAAAEEAQRQAELTVGAATAAYGASGVSGASGSAVDVLADEARRGTLNKLNTLYDYQLKATSYRDQAALDKYQSRTALFGGILSAAGSAAGGLSTARLLNASQGAGYSLPFNNTGSGV